MHEAQPLIPTFAVVGHPNKGKSSIVATLAEDDRLLIGSTPGTTRAAHAYTFKIDNQPQYVLIDTPGFQRARAVLEWLEARAGSADERGALVAQFVAEHDQDERFVDECELLRPILNGAGILYVVDGTKPYGAEYELEMQILQWTGQPRMALINMIGTGDYQTEWRGALNQYFSLVRVFDAVHADFETRIALLRGFGELDEQWRQPLETAVVALQEERARRQRRSAGEIADCLLDTLTYTERASLTDQKPAEPIQNRLIEKLQKKIRKREQRARDAVQRIYRHPHLERREASTELLQTDLFTEQGWELFGLSNLQLAVSGAVTGALAGGGIDVLFGGATLLLGAGIGAVIGGVSAWFGGHELAKVSVLGETLGGRVMQVGPVSAPNFPWVMLGRAWMHHHLVAERNHALRDAISAVAMREQNLMDSLTDDLRKSLARCFKKFLDQGGNVDLGTHLTDLIDQVLSHSPPKHPSRKHPPRKKAR